MKNLKRKRKRVLMIVPLILAAVILMSLINHQSEDEEEELEEKTESYSQDEEKELEEETESYEERTSDSEESQQNFDFTGVFHKENLSPTLLPIMSEDGMGFINEKGQVVMEPIEGLDPNALDDQGIPQDSYDLPMPFLIFEKEGQSYGEYLIDEEGRIFEGEEAREMIREKRALSQKSETRETHQDVIAVRDGKEILVNLNNEKILDGEYDEIEHIVTFEKAYSEAERWVATVYKEEWDYSRSVFSLKSGEHYGFFIISEKGEWLEEPAFDKLELDPLQSMGIRNVRYPYVTSHFGVKKEGKWAVADLKAMEFSTEFRFDEIDTMQGTMQGRIWINHYDSDVLQGYATVDGKQGLYDFYHDRWIVEPEDAERELHLLRDDRRKVKQDGKYGYKNEENEWVIEPAYQSAEEYHMGFAVVTTKEDRMIIDREGQILYQQSKEDQPYNFGITHLPELELISGGKYVYFTLDGDVIYPEP